jgi:hypothetical protein
LTPPGSRSYVVNNAGFGLFGGRSSDRADQLDMIAVIRALTDLSLRFPIN